MAQRKETKLTIKVRDLKPKKDAKGGVAVAIAHDLKLPIRYVGVGEGIDDLIPFSPQEYVDALFQEKW